MAPSRPLPPSEPSPASGAPEAPSAEAQARAHELLQAMLEGLPGHGEAGDNPATSLRAALHGLRAAAAEREGARPLLADGSLPEPEAGPEAASAPAPPPAWAAAPPAGRYPALALALNLPDGAPLGSERPPAAPAPSLRARHEGRHRQALVRPPVRSLLAPQASQAIAEGAEVALYQQGAEEQSFDIALDQELLGNVRCRIALTPRGVEATFVVARASERWLLDGEAAALRAKLEGRGLKVAAIRVFAEDDPAAPALLTDLIR